MSSGKNLPRVFALIGTGVQCLVLVGLAVTVYRLVRVFLFIMETGNDDPQMLAGMMSAALVPTMLGLIVGVAGTIISFVTALVTRYRARWFFWWSLCFSIVYVFSLVGLPFLVYLLIIRKQFFASSGTDGQAGVSA